MDGTGEGPGLSWINLQGGDTRNVQASKKRA
jgi:hypothetical protein